MRIKELVMPFEVAMAYKKDGGEQNTLYSWFGDTDSVINQENGIQWLWVATTESASHYDSVERSKCWPNGGKPLCAAPIIATEIPVASIQPTRESPWVSTTDRAPNDNESTPYLCMRRYEGKSKPFYQRQILVFNPDHMVWDNEDGDDFNCELNQVSHWMPLPAPPSTEGGAQ